MTNHENLLGNLLAIIHRDGGHYIDDNGWEKAVEDAIQKVYDDRAKLEPQMSATPWLWVEGGSASRLDSTGAVIAEVSKPLEIEWLGWVLLYGAKRILRGDSAEDVMGRIDAILEGAGWTLPSGDPPPTKKPITANRVVAALVKDPKLAEEVRDLLNKHFT